MAYTKIIVIHNRLDRCLNYTQDEEKTSLEAVLDYAMNRDKTEQDCFETALNCDRETAYADMMDEDGSIPVSAACNFPSFLYFSMISLTSSFNGRVDVRV